MRTIIVALFISLLMAMSASAGTKWTHDKEGTGPEVDYLFHNAYAYYVFDAVEESNWIKVGVRSHVDICATANIATALANGVQLQIVKSILHHDETPDINYSEIVLGLTLSGFGSGGCITSGHPGWYKVIIIDAPDTGSGMVSIVESALWE